MASIILERVSKPVLKIWESIVKAFIPKRRKLGTVNTFPKQPTEIHQVM